MPHGMKITKSYVQKPAATPVSVDLGFPNNGQTNNGYDISKPGVTGSRNSSSGGAPIQGLNFTAVAGQTGLGTLDASTASTTVTFSEIVGIDYAINIGAGSRIYVNGVLLGVVATIALGLNTATLVANAAFDVTAGAFTYNTPPSLAWMVSSKGKSKFLLANYNTYTRGCYMLAGQSFVLYGYDQYINQIYPPWTGLEANLGGRFIAQKSGTQVYDVPVGSANLVGIQIAEYTLVNKANANLLAGEANILATKGDASTFYVAKIVNNFVYDFNGNKYIATLTGASSTPDAATGLQQVSLPYFV